MPRKASERTRDKTAAVSRKLTRLYGTHEVECGSDPVDTLVQTILSQNTSDANSHRSFAALKRAYHDWDLLLDADPAKIAGIIRSGGLADMKARRIVAALSYIRRERGRIELDFLREFEPTEADAWLAHMKGVGPKTRAIVLLFSLGMPAFPVDTHIHRVTRRLGLIDWKASREAAQEALARLVPQKDFYSFHINVIMHGRRICRSRNPLCRECALSRMCDYYRTRVRAEA